MHWRDKNPASRVVEMGLVFIGIQLGNLVVLNRFTSKGVIIQSEGGFFVCFFPFLLEVVVTAFSGSGNDTSWLDFCMALLWRSAIHDKRYRK